MTRSRGKQQTKTDEETTPKKSASKTPKGFKKDGDNFTHSAESGHHVIASPVAGGGFSVTVCGSETGPVIYSTTVADQAALEGTEW